MIKRFPVPLYLDVGIIDGKETIVGIFQGEYLLNGKEKVSGPFSITLEQKKMCLHVGQKKYILESEPRFVASKNSSFLLEDVTIGKGFHWEKRERQVFPGNLKIRIRNDGLFSAINEVVIEDYLKSVISSEMNPLSPLEFLKAHAVSSRSWLLSKKMKRKKKDVTLESEPKDGRIIKVYGNEEHKLFDVCADDHCQRYHGITKILSNQVEYAVEQTDGLVLVYGDEICDTRYSKCCGGITEKYSIAWEEKELPYLLSISDSIETYGPLATEKDLIKWIEGEPKVFCNVRNEEDLSKIVTDLDEKTKDFFRWKVVVSKEEIENLIKAKTGIDIGEIEKIKPIARGPSGRIKEMLIEGTKARFIVGKELEIRRILSPTHLLSSAFFITEEKDRKGRVKSFILKGAGWGHGVGMCQIGAARMALMGYSYQEILAHYFRGAKVAKIYEEKI
ncbi:MAG: SpoIID/LytB domain-containing protein [Deltaproteobacteria bacterium]|nr:SpoIID/LytB domain-containing protein [Deltaproteobacteria bacterium]